MKIGRLNQGGDYMIVSPAGERDRLTAKQTKETLASK